MESRDLNNWLQTKDSLRSIANYISQKIDRKLDPPEIRDLKKKINGYSSYYEGQVDSPNDEQGFKNIQKDIARRYLKVIREREEIPASTMNTHEMLKAEITDANKEVHEASGFTELKYQDEWCFDGEGKMAKSKYGGRSGKDLGLFGEQPNIAMSGFGEPIIVSDASDYPHPPDYSPSRAANSTNANANTVARQKPANMSEEQWTAFQDKFMQGLRNATNQELELEKQLAEEEKERDDLMFDTIKDQKKAIDNINASIRKLTDMAEYFYKSQKTKDETPADKKPDATIGFKDAYLQFDTRFRNTTFSQTDNVGKFQWVVSSVPFNSTDTGVGVVFPIDNIMEMEISEFDIPQDNTYPNYYNSVSLFIEEFNTQAVMGSEGTRHHWLFKTTDMGSVTRLTPTRRNFTFKDPIKTISNMTFTFRWPYQLLPFNIDRMDATLTPNSNPAEWTTALPHNINTNNPVYFRNVSTGDVTLDEQINTVNGLQITKIDAFTFTVPIDFTTVGTAIVTEVYFGSKRILIPIRFRCISYGKATNYMSTTGENDT